MIVLSWVRFFLSALCMAAGMLTLLAATVGMFRFGYVLNRIHVASKCDTLGVLLTFASLMLMSGWNAVTLKLLLIIIFFWIAMPVCSHLVAHLEVATNPKVTDECEVMRYFAD